jgi:hypothetical protein
VTLEEKRKIVAKWIRENYPTSIEREADKERKTVEEVIKESNSMLIKQCALKARINLYWRELLSERLQLDTDEVVRATNTILEILEKNLKNGNIVRIRNFGDFSLSERDELTVVQFAMDRAWAREINEPKNEKELGLRKTYTKRLLRRTDQEVPNT